ncbi:MAG: hypothetical protein H8M99_09085 [Gloeobacteraceae cyanobacterium ES-bin-144]|nr:hypothetical protein [Verrucomicrobiales bacterium]
MSPREKKLLLMFAAAGFVILNFLAFGFFQSKKIAVERGLEEAKQKLVTAETFRASSEQVTEEMNWLAEHEPEPAANQDVQTKLQQFCEQQAKSAGLSIKSQKPLPTEATPGAHYHRAKIQIMVNGTEEALYRWFDNLNMPDQLRIASTIRMTPNKEDDTKIDCTATIEQWFVPLPPSA